MSLQCSITPDRTNSSFWAYRILSLLGKTATEVQHPGHVRFFSIAGPVECVRKRLATRSSMLSAVQGLSVMMRTVLCTPASLRLIALQQGPNIDSVAAQMR